MGTVCRVARQTGRGQVPENSTHATDNNCAGDSLGTWYVYVLECADQTLYTGITTDLERRLQEHNAGKASARYTRARRPVRLVYQEQAANRSIASRREYAIKRLSRARKLAMIAVI